MSKNATFLHSNSTDSLKSEVELSLKGKLNICVQSSSFFYI